MFMYKQVWPLAMLALLRTEPRDKWQGSVFVFVVHTLLLMIRAGGSFYPTLNRRMQLGQEAW